MVNPVETFGFKFFGPLNESFKIPLSFLEIFKTVLFLVTGDVFDYVAFKKIKGVAFDVIDTLNYVFAATVVAWSYWIVGGVQN